LLFITLLYANEGVNHSPYPHFILPVFILLLVEHVKESVKVEAKSFDWFRGFLMQEEDVWTWGVVT